MSDLISIKQENHAIKTKDVRDYQISLFTMTVLIKRKIPSNILPQSSFKDNNYLNFQNTALKNVNRLNEKKNAVHLRENTVYLI